MVSQTCPLTADKAQNFRGIFTLTPPDEREDCRHFFRFWLDFHPSGVQYNVYFYVYVFRIQIQIVRTSMFPKRPYFSYALIYVYTFTRTSLKLHGPFFYTFKWFSHNSIYRTINVINLKLLNSNFIKNKVKWTILLSHCKYNKRDNITLVINNNLIKILLLTYWQHWYFIKSIIILIKIINLTPGVSLT